MVMVVLSAQDSDRHVNQIAQKIFNAYPDMKALSKINAANIASQQRLPAALRVSRDVAASEAKSQ